MKVTERNRFNVGDIVQLIVSAISHKVTGRVQHCEIDPKDGSMESLELSVFDPIRMAASFRRFEKKELETVSSLSVIGHGFTEQGWDELCRLARNIEIIERMR